MKDRGCFLVTVTTPGRPDTPPPCVRCVAQLEPKCLSKRFEAEGAGVTIQGDGYHRELIDEIFVKPCWV